MHCYGQTPPPASGTSSAGSTAISVAAQVRVFSLLGSDVSCILYFLIVCNVSSLVLNSHSLQDGEGGGG